VSVVLDASMAIAWLFDDERTPASHAVMPRVVARGALVPQLWRLEVANILHNAVRRKRCGEAYVERSLARLGRLAIRPDDETDQHAWRATRILARDEGLTLYDAAYLELAIRSQRALATCDAELASAAQRRSVDILNAL
jgi:predicted nucleic acid-binding protein